MGQGHEYDMPSGAKLQISDAPFVDAKKLHDGILRAMKGMGVADIDLSKLKNGGAAVELIIEKVIALASSDEVEAAIFKCADRALYTPAGGSVPLKVTKGMFDDGDAGIKAREDFYHIAGRIIEVNFLPFLKPLFSASKLLDAVKVGAQA